MSNRASTATDSFLVKSGTNPSDGKATQTNLRSRAIFISKKPTADPDAYGPVPGLGLEFDKDDLIDVMEAFHDGEHDFQRKALSASTLMIENALKKCKKSTDGQEPLTLVVDEENTKIYQFNDEEMKKVGLYIGLIRGGRHNPVMESDFAVALFRRKKVEVKTADDSASNLSKSAQQGSNERSDEEESKKMGLAEANTVETPTETFQKQSSRQLRNLNPVNYRERSYSEDSYQADEVSRNDATSGGEDAHQDGGVSKLGASSSEDSYQEDGDPRQRCYTTRGLKRNHSFNEQSSVKQEGLGQEGLPQVEELVHGLRQKSLKSDNFATGLTSASMKLNEFEFLCYLSIAEFKMPGPEKFDVNKRNGVIRDPEFHRKYSFLNQEMLYVFDLVWPGLRGCGLSPSEIPLVGIVGKKKTKTSETISSDGVMGEGAKKASEIQMVAAMGTAEAVETLEIQNIGLNGEKAKERDIATVNEKEEADNADTNKLRFFQGALIPNYKCCEQFVYCIRNFGTFGGNEAATAEQAALALKSVVFFGFEKAVEAVMALIASAGGEPVCKPLSGDELIIEGETSQVQLYPAQLKVLATPVSRGRQNAAVKVSLADLFDGTLPSATWTHLRKPPHRNISSIWFCSPTKKDSSGNEDRYVDEDRYVIVKVSSSIVHFELVAFVRVFNALQRIERDELLTGKLPLLAIFWLPWGIVTIMRDLRKEGYKVLHPQALTSKFSWQELWDGTSRMILEVLLNLAKHGVVHCDVRPAYDVTANILVNDEGEQLQLILVDYESLVQFTELDNVAGGTDGRYIGSKFAKDAVEHVWWQCVAIAHVWSMKITEEVLLKESENALSYALDDLSELAATAVMENRPVNQDEFFDLESCLLNDKKIRGLLAKKKGLKTDQDLKDLLKRVSEFFKYMDGKKKEAAGQSSDGIDA